MRDCRQYAVARNLAVTVFTPCLIYFAASPGNVTVASKWTARRRD